MKLTSCTTGVALLFSASLLASTAVHAQPSSEVKNAYERSNYGKVVEILLPQYRAGQLHDGESLRLLAVSCQESGKGGFRGLLGNLSRGGGQSCAQEASTILESSAKAGNVDAMYSLAVAQGPHPGVFAIPGLPENQSASHYWTVLGGLLATTPRVQQYFGTRSDFNERHIPAHVRDSARNLAYADYPAYYEKLSRSQPQLADRRAEVAAMAGQGDAHYDDEFGDDYNVQAADPSIMDCNPKELRPGRTLTVTFGDMSRILESSGHAELALTRHSDGTMFLLAYQSDMDDPQNGMLVKTTDLVRTRTLELPHSLRAVSDFASLDTLQPVFTKAGEYSLYLTQALDSGVGGVTCDFVYRP